MPMDVRKVGIREHESFEEAPLSYIGLLSELQVDREK